MKLAVSGKGGVGKTTLSAMLAGAAALKGQDVVAIDADPDANLGSALGVPPDEPITPLADMEELIKERTGATGGYGGYFKLNPRVDDIPDEYARRIGNIRLLVLGGVAHGGDGCICPATAVLKALLIHLVLGRDDALVMDMEAGIEHLGRATAASMDGLIVVVNPGAWSVQTAHRVRRLAGEIGTKKVYAVVNRVRRPEEVDWTRRQLGEIPLIGQLPEDDRFGGAVLRVGGDGRVEACAALEAYLPAVEGMLAELRNRL